MRAIIHESALSRRSSGAGGGSSPGQRVLGRGVAPSAQDVVLADVAPNRRGMDAIGLPTALYPAE
jgi:hypothetical protein